MATPSGIEAIKAELFRGPVPDEYVNLLGQSLFEPSLPRHMATFSDDSAEIVSRFPFFVGNRRKNPKLKPEAEIIDGITDDTLTRFGHSLRAVVRDRTFIDLGCGPRDHAQVPRIIAQALGARRYIGVDSAEVKDEIQVEESQSRQFEAVYLEDEMLSFVSKLRTMTGVVFYLSGIEPSESAGPNYLRKANIPARLERALVTERYIDSMLREIDRVTLAGDGIVIGECTYRFKPAKYGFTRTAVKEQHKLYIK